MIVSESTKSKTLANEFEYEFFNGDHEKFFQKNTINFDLVIIATKIDKLVSIAKVVIKNQIKSILIEKPGSLFYKDLEELNKLQKDQKIRVAYNRIVYPSLLKLKEMIKLDGGISSCKFSITEKLERINFQKDKPDIYKKFGISNTLHPISIVFELIGDLKEFSSKQFGGLKWHPTGSIFVGSGISENKIPFSYHGDWNSRGGWEIEIMTKNNVFKMNPLEELKILNIKTNSWEILKVKNFMDNVKLGIGEEVVLMLNDKMEKEIQLIDLEKAVKLNKIAEKIFGYSMDS